MRTRHSFVALAVVAGLVAGGCASNTSTEPTEPAAPAEPAEPMAADSADYTATEFSFDGPTELAAGTTAGSLTNDGTQDHHMLLVRFDQNQDWTEEEVISYIEQNPE